MDTLMMQGEVKRSGWWLAMLRSIAQAGYWTMLEPVTSPEDDWHAFENRRDSFFTDGPQGRMVLVEIQSFYAASVTAANSQ